MPEKIELRLSTSTPVIDTTTNTVYLTHKTYDGSGNAEWFMDALNITTGAEQTDFGLPLVASQISAVSTSASPPIDCPELFDGSAMASASCVHDSR